MSAEPRYCHKCKAWHSPTDAGWQAGCVSELSPAHGSAAPPQPEILPGLLYGGRGPGGEYYSKVMDDLESEAIWVRDANGLRWTPEELETIASDMRKRQNIALSGAGSGSARIMEHCEMCNNGLWISTGGHCYCAHCGRGLSKPERYWNKAAKEFLYRQAPNDRAKEH